MEILSTENNNVALSVTDRIYCCEVEHGVITCARWLQEILWMGSNSFSQGMLEQPKSQNDQLLIMSNFREKG